MEPLTDARSKADGEASLLLVDDVPANLVALEALLAQPGYRIVRARSGEEALRRVLDEDFAVILLDVVMPGIDGFELATLLKRRARTRHTPIIFISANGNDEKSVYRGYSVGAVDYLYKPLTPEVVRAKVAGLVELHRRNQQIRREADALRALERTAGERLAELDAARTQRYRALAEAIPSIVCVADPEGAVLACNRRWFDYTGLSEEQARAWGWLAAVHPEDAPETVSRWRAAIAGGDTVELECRLRRAQDGAFRWHLARGVPDRAPDGSLTSYLTVITDIDDLKRAQAEAEAERRRSEFLSRASAVLSATLEFEAGLAQVAELAARELGDFCLVDLCDGSDEVRTVAVAAAEPEGAALATAARTCSRSDDESLRSGAPQRWSAGDPDAAPCPARLALLGAQAFISVPLRARGLVLGALTFVRTRPGAYLEREVQLALELAGRASLAVDNGLLYREARDAARTREEFLSIASHELKTPLTSLRLLLQMMLRRLGNAQPELTLENVAAQLAKAERQSVRLTQLIEELLDVSRLMARKLTLETADVELDQLLHEVLDELDPALQRAGTQVALHVEGPVAGRWDRSRLEQVLANLLGNAVKYGRGMPVELSVSGDAEQVEIAVRDHGIGIGAEHLERIFDPFERAVSHSYGGLGLGLYITRQIVELHGGEIRADSTPGEGSCFTVRLPRHAPATAEGAAIH